MVPIERDYVAMPVAVAAPDLVVVTDDALQDDVPSGANVMVAKAPPKAKTAPRVKVVVALGRSDAKGVADDIDAWLPFLVPGGRVLVLHYPHQAYGLDKTVKPRLERAGLTGPALVCGGFAEWRKPV